MAVALAAVAQSLSTAAWAQLDVDAPPIAGQPQGTAPTTSSGISLPGNSGAARGGWRFTPSIEVDETYSDNINLSPAGSERSDFVTTISPMLALTRYGARLTTNFSYAPQLLLYARGTAGTQVRNYLNATANATIVENFLFFDALTSVSQTNVSPFGTLSNNSVNNSANRAETRSYSLGPTLRSHSGSDITYSAGYHYTGSTSNNSAYAANHTSQVFAQIDSGTSLRNLGYGLDVSRSEQGYGAQGSIVQETGGVTLTYVLTPTIHLRGRVGEDIDSYPTTGRPDLKGVSYSGGFDWQPSQHTQLNAQFGQRYFGPTASVSLRETTSKVAVTATYSRDQTTSSGTGLGLVSSPTYAVVDQFYRATITDPALRAQAVTAALSQAGYSTSQFAQATFLSNQLYVQKVAQISIALLGLRNTVTFDASRNESQGLSAVSTAFDVFNQASRFRSTTIDANWSHRLGPRTSANMTAMRTHNQAVSGSGDTRIYQLTASLSRQIQPRLNGTILVRHTQQTSENPTTAAATSANAVNSSYYGGNYRENAVLGSLRLSF
jgi:uncharacterized protein (PEP-CTERM system associated)